MKNNLNQYEDGQGLDHETACSRFDNVIMNKHHDFVSNKETVNKYCGACIHTSVCKALLGNYNSSFNTRR